MDLSRFARFKRLMEKWQIDPVFRSEAESGRSAFFSAEDPELISEAIHVIHQGNALNLPSNPYAREFCERFFRCSRYLSGLFQPSSFHDQDVYGYLQRVRNRCRMESALIRYHPNIYYYPLAFELSRGCRIGCDFCGLMAERWSADAPYDRTFWRDIIRASFDFLGPIAGECPCYYATEPLDHPDYERFLADVEEITGHIPQTTTAAADREPERVRDLIHRLGEDRLRDQGRLRLSIRSVRQFERIAELFSPEELAYVELLPNNCGSVYRVSDSGRNRANQDREKYRYSISCLAGIRVNLADRTMTFIEPVLPDEAHPCGYRVLDKVTFDDAADYSEKLGSLFRRYAHAGLPKHETVRIHPEVQVKHETDQILLTADGVAYRIPKNRWNEQMLQELAAGSSFAEIFQSLGLPEEYERDVYDLLNRMFCSGYLIEQIECP